MTVRVFLDWGVGRHLVSSGENAHKGDNEVTEKEEAWK